MVILPQSKKWGGKSATQVDLILYIQYPENATPVVVPHCKPKEQKKDTQIVLSLLQPKSFCWNASKYFFPKISKTLCLLINPSSVAGPNNGVGYQQLSTALCHLHGDAKWHSASCM